MYQPSNPLSAFDGMPLAGEWILTIEDLEPGNIGTFEDWFLQIEAVLGLDDTVRSSPAIGEDGTIYVTTAKGFLIALGVGCPEPDPVIPPYSYRVVAEEGQLIDGVTIQEFEHVEIGEDGLVSFQALVSPGNVAASFRELGDGSFQVIAQGTVIDNAEVDAAFLARVDAAGTPYMPANILKLGTAVFIDDLMVMHEGPDEHHISIADFERFDYVDPDEQGRFVVYGRQESTDPPSLLLVDPKDSSITPLVSHGQIIEGFMVENLDPAFVDGFGDDGVVLFRASDGSTKAIATNDRIVAREGDEIDGRVLLHVEMPRRNADGWFYYIGEHAPAGGRSIFLESPEGMDAFARGVGDTVAGQPILSVLSFAVNNQNNLAYVALSVGAGGVFVDDQPVAVVNISRIDGQLVTGVENTLSINESHQIAFVANVAGGPEQLYVATFDSDIDDCNENDIPDCEELQAGTASDCNTNGLLDECDISEGESSDNNANGVPDECECLADFDGSDTVDAFDLALLLGSWGPCPGCPADIDGNGVVDAFDLAQLLGSWGPC